MKYLRSLLIHTSALIHTGVLIFTAVLILTSCEKLSKPSDEVEHTEVAYADVSDACFLGITDCDPAVKNNFVKITTAHLEGIPKRVDFLDENVEILEGEYSKVFVDDIFVVSPEYTVFWGSFTFDL
jgi:hypothetical protein